MDKEDSIQKEIHYSDKTAEGFVRSKKPFTLEEMLSLFKVDTKIWKAERYVINSWDVTNSDGETYKNYQCKVWLVRVQELYNLEVAHKDFIDNALKHKPSCYKTINYKQKTGVLLELAPFDLHFDKLCWSGEVGENYDTKIAKQLLMKSLVSLVSRAKLFGFEKILFVVGNDFFNSDNSRSETEFGTRQDTDLRWQKAYQTGRELIVECIDYLRTFAPVDVLIVPGNHDGTRMYYIGDSIACWYHGVSGVNVINNASPRKYYTFGSVLLGFTHGTEEKIASLPIIMSQETKQDWANTKYKEWHLGHTHRKREIKYLASDEELGVIVRYLRSLTGTDSWHHRKGYVANIRGTNAFLWSKTNGMIAMLEDDL